MGTSRARLTPRSVELQVQPPDLLIADLGMAGISGVAVVQELSRAGSLRRVLLLSGQGAHSDRDRLELRSCPLLAKPFTAHELLRSVRAAIGHPSLSGTGHDHVLDTVPYPLHAPAADWMDSH